MASRKDTTLDSKKTRRKSRDISLSKELSTYLIGVFKEYNLTMKLKFLSKDYFAFSIKETHSPSIDFNYDKFCIEIAVRYKKFFYDLIPMVGVPFCRKEKGRFVAYWLDEKGDRIAGDYKTKKELIKSHVDLELRKWLDTYLKPNTYISLYKSPGGSSWTKLIDKSLNKKLHKKTFKDNDDCFVRLIPLWKLKKKEGSSDFF